LVQQQGFLASEPDRFGRAFLLAAALEILALLAIAHLPKPKPPVPPSTVQIHVVKPAPKAVVAKPKPPPPKPPPPVPVPPQPVTPPLPAPPPPQPHHPVVHRVIHHVVHTPPPPPVPVPQPPAPVAPETAAPPPSPIAEQTVMSHYIGEVRAIVQGNLIVPQVLVSAGLAGRCVLEFTVAPDGTLLSASILTPSGLHAVNEAAMDALRSSRLPAFLKGMPAGPHAFTLPVRVSGAEQ
jgi:protein TonB